MESINAKEKTPYLPPHSSVNSITEEGGIILLTLLIFNSSHVHQLFQPFEPTDGWIQLLQIAQIKEGRAAHTLYRNIKGG